MFAKMYKRYCYVIFLNDVKIQWKYVATLVNFWWIKNRHFNWNFLCFMKDWIKFKHFLFYLLFRFLFKLVNFLFHILQNFFQQQCNFETDLFTSKVNSFILYWPHMLTMVWRNTDVKYQCRLKSKCSLIKTRIKLFGVLRGRGRSLE
jgi:hypothetical protein